MGVAPRVVALLVDDCGRRRHLGRRVETCTIRLPRPFTLFIGVYGASDFSGDTLTLSYKQELPARGSRRPDHGRVGGALSGLTTLADHEIADAWDALGEAFHKRLERNYVTWVRRYVGQTRLLRTFTPEELRRRPVTWTIRGLTPAVAFFENVVTAHAADLLIGLQGDGIDD